MWVNVIQGCHVFFGVLWLGGVVFNNAVVVPAANKTDPVHANPFLANYSKFVDRYMHPVGLLTIIFGIVLGFPLNAWNAIGHTYGNTYLISFILAMLIYLWGILMIGKNIKKALGFPHGSSEFVAIIDNVKKFAMVEMVGFLALFVLMVVLASEH